MKIKITLFSILLLNSLFLSAQIKIDWQQCYGSMERDEACGIIENNHGGFYVAGYVGGESGMISCNFEDPNRCWFIEIDDLGELVGEECILLCMSLKGLIKSDDLGYFLVGSANKNSEYDRFIEVIKYGNDGNPQWRTLAGDPERGVGEVPYVSSTSDGGVVATSFVQWPCGPGGEYYGMNDAWVVKINSDGGQDWDIMLGSEGFEMPLGILGESNGNVIVAVYGYAFGNGNVASCHRTKHDAIITKLSADGEIIWSRCYGGDEEDVIMCITELPDGYIFAGETESEDADLEGAGYHIGYPHNIPSYGRTRDIWLMRTDFDGNIIWSKCYGGSGKEGPNKVFQNEDGGFTVFGTSKSIDGDVQSGQNLHLAWDEYTNSRIWVFRTDAEGNLLWERAIGHKGNDIDLSDVIKHNEKEYTLAATSASATNPETQGDYNCTNAPLLEHGYKNWWVLHITDIFNYDDPTGIEEQPKVVPLQMKVHPNPATTWVAIDYTLPNGNVKAELSIFNAMGIRVKQLELEGNEGQKVLDLRELSNGVYTITVLCGEYYLTEKLVITK